MFAMSRQWIVWPVLSACVLAAPAAGQQQPPAAAFSDEAVERAVDQCKAYLWSLYRADPRQDPWPDVRTTTSGGRATPYVNYGGRSALIMYALLTAGEKHTDPRMRRALDWLSRIDSKGTYTLGARMQVWAHLPRNLGRPMLVKDSARLVKSICRPPKGAAQWSHHFGGYTYTSDPAKPTTRADNSNTHFGILGVWAAARSGVEVPDEYWKLVYEHYVRSQSSDGSWRYGVSPGPPARGGSYGQYPPGGMTAAGLANLFVAWEHLHTRDFVRCGRNPDHPKITAALAWMEKNFGKYANGYHYYLYALERVSLACGWKFFGDKDWYKLSATQLLKTQRADGSWARQGFGDNHDLVATAFAMIFLARGRNPILFNRLQYDGDWNNRPRALSHLTRWVSGQFEREINWQIVDVKTPPEQWHDAPVLLITGAKAPKLTDEQIARIRRFVHQGGRIWTIAECRTLGGPFDAAWRGRGGKGGLYQTLFPNYELKRLPPDHPIYNGQLRMRRKYALWGLSNGVRLLAIHTNEDLPLPWQTAGTFRALDAYHLPVNLSLYVNDHSLGRTRGTSPWPEEKPFTPLRVAKVARVEYAGHWDPEPLAWERLRILMGRHWQVRLSVATVPAAGLNAATQRVAHVTGTAALALAADEKKSLADYVRAGGTLIFDAAGGSKAFADSAEKLVEEIFDGAVGRRLPMGAAVWQMPGLKINAVDYRTAARKRVADDRTPRVLGVTVAGRLAVFISREDLTCGLVGYPSASCDGYAPGTVARPGSAVLLTRNMVVYGNSKARSPTSAPARGP